jgi:glycosyltransferase involved in cell wall biosynthesis
MKLLVLTRYGPLGASSRYRTFQFLPYLQRAGIDVQVAPLFDDRYLGSIYRSGKRPVRRVAAAYASRTLRAIRSRGYDLVWLEKELAPFLPGWYETALFRLGAPVVVDYDDAIFHNYDRHGSPVVRHLLGRKIDAVMRSSKAVVAGNDYLAARARSAGAKRVEILPTVVDTERYTFAPMPANETLTIGWIGSPITTRYLEQFRPTIAKMCEAGRARFVAIGASALDWPDVPVEVRPWSETSEVAELHGFDVGIMPLPDSPWERGKCGFKLIQYMACGRPVIGSPVGVNSQIIEDGVNGFLASTDRDWLAAVERLREEKGLRRDMGANGRQLVESQYSTQVIGPRLVEILTSVARNAS